jgi:hypothetical protein
MDRRDGECPLCAKSGHSGTGDNIMAAGEYQHTIAASYDVSQGRLNRGMLLNRHATAANEAAGLPPRTRVVLRNRVRGSRQLIVAQSADDILDREIDPGVRDVIAMRHVG